MIKWLTKEWPYLSFLIMNVETLDGIQVLVSNAETTISNIADQDGDQNILEQIRTTCCSIVCMLNNFLGDDGTDNESGTKEVSTIIFLVFS